MLTPPNSDEEGEELTRESLVSKIDALEESLQRKHFPLHEV